MQLTQKNDSLSSSGSQLYLITLREYGAQFLVNQNSEKESLLNDISKIEEKESEIVKYFGFRELSVDHEVYIQTKLAAPEYYGDKPYQSVYKLVVNTRGQSITMKLTQLQV